MRRRPIRRLVVALVAAVGLSAGLVGASPLTAPAQQNHATACPELSDSVVRLYSAYFLRDPDGPGFDYWYEIYRSGAGNLDVISNSFAAQEEFFLRYGNLDDAQFVELVYRNVLGRSPDAAGFAHWTTSLANGFSRGELMISFSESEEYVRQTRTAAPLAGYGMWYPRGTRWTCGEGSQDWAVDPGATPYMDVLFLNAGSTRRTFGGQALTSGGTVLETLFSEAIDADTYHFYWNLPTGTSAGTGVLRVTAPDDGYVAVVAMPVPHSPDRPGWGS